MNHEDRFMRHIHFFDRGVGVNLQTLQTGHRLQEQMDMMDGGSPAELLPLDHPEEGEPA